MAVAEWTDPRPQFPPSDAFVLVKCSDGTVRYARHNKHDGWFELGNRFWSMAHPVIEGWKPANWPPQTDEEEAACARVYPEWKLPTARRNAGVDVPEGGKR